MGYPPTVALVYVAGMVAMAVYETATSELKMTVGDRQIDLRLAWGLLAGILWPIWLVCRLAVKIPFVEAAARRAAVRFVRKLGLPTQFTWTPPRADGPIPGFPDDYPQIDAESIRAGRRVGKWGLVLAETALPGWPWATVAWHPGRAPNDCVMDLFDDEAEARECFRWTREADLDEAAAGATRLSPDDLAALSVDKKGSA